MSRRRRHLRTRVAAVPGSTSSTAAVRRRARSSVANLLRGLGVMCVVGALAVTAAAHAFVASDQQRIDTLQGQLTQTLAQQQDLQLARAELESPVRVLAIAERQLGMVAPGSVSYLPPVDPGPSVYQAGESAARAALAGAAAARQGHAVQVLEAGQERCAFGQVTGEVVARRDPAADDPPRRSDERDGPL